MHGNRPIFYSVWLFATGVARAVDRTGGGIGLQKCFPSSSAEVPGPRRGPWLGLGPRMDPVPGSRLGCSATIPGYRGRSVPDSGPRDVTGWLEAASAGDPRAARELLPLVYAQLRKAAQLQMAGERPDHTLQATALVHEAYLRLVGSRQTNFDNAGHFYVAAAEAMRRILIEHARKRGRVKRGGDLRRISLSAAYLAEEARPEEIMSVADAIGRLEKRDGRMAKIVRLRFFTGLSIAETAEVLGVSGRTVRREWALARAWLHRELSGGKREAGEEPA